MTSQVYVKDITDAQPCDQPYTIDELIVLALEELGYATRQGIYEWLVTRAQRGKTEKECYYILPDEDDARQMIFYPKGTSKVHDRWLLDAQVTQHIRYALLKLGMPVICLPYGRNSSINRHHRLYRLDPPAARVFIGLMRSRLLKRHWIETFDYWFELPAELREMILDMLLVFAPQKIAIVCAKGSVAKLLSHDVIEEFHLGDAYNWRSRIFLRYLKQAPPVDKHLAILKVNKMMLQEAMPIFYQKNRFVCWDLRHLRQFLTRASQERKSLIRNFEFWHDPSKNFWLKGTNPLYTIASCQTMAQWTWLRNLTIRFERRYWESLERADGTPRYPDLRQVMGLAELRKMRGLKITVEGDCDEVRDVLESEMGRPKIENVDDTEATEAAERETAEREAAERDAAEREAAERDAAEREAAGRDEDRMDVDETEEDETDVDDMNVDDAGSDSDYVP